jgi:hypothetical protein
LHSDQERRPSFKGMCNRITLLLRSFRVCKHKKKFENTTLLHTPKDIWSNSSAEHFFKFFNKSFIISRTKLSIVKYTKKNIQTIRKLIFNFICWVKYAPLKMFILKLQLLKTFHKC